MRLLLSLVIVLVATKTGSSITNVCTPSTSILFILDSSGSVIDYQNNWDQVRRFTSMAIENLAQSVTGPSGLQIAVVQFSDQAYTTFNFNTYRRYTEAADAVLRITNLGGTTNLVSGLREAERILPRQSSSTNTVIVIISDFRGSSPMDELITAQRIKFRNDVKIITVGIQGIVDEALMRQIASDNRVVLTPDYNALRNYISPLINVMCTSENFLEPSSQCARDIVLVMDASISTATWPTLKEFVALVAANIANTDRNTRIGVVSFSDNGRVISNLVLYSQSLSIAITNAAHNQGLTDIADGLRQAQGLLTDRNRKRHVIIFTDGFATRERGLEASVADNMRRDGINIVAYGVGSSIDKETLESLIAVNQQNTHVIMNPTYSTRMISQINQVVALASCSERALDPICVLQQADVVLAIDASGSIVDKGPNNWRLMKQFATELIRGLVSKYRQIRIGALYFSGFAETFYEVTSNYQEVIRAIELGKNQMGTTNQVAALRKSGDMLNNAPPSGDRQKIVIMITDGEHNFGGTTVTTAANELQRYGITRIVVGVTSDINHRNLMEIASRPELIFYSESFETLNLPLITNVVSATRNCPDTPDINAARAIPDPTPCQEVDVIFAMDRSGSIEDNGSGNYQRIKDLISDLARAMHTRFAKIRFGLVAFSEGAQIIQWLTTYRNIEEFVDIIQRVPYYGGYTNLADAIKESRWALTQDGARTPQIIIVSDGETTAGQGFEFSEAMTAQRFGIRISAIAVSRYIDEDSLIKITGSRERVFRAPNFERLDNVITDVTRVACQPQGSTARACTGLPEIVFLLDISASIEDYELRSAKDFIKNAMNSFLQGNPNSRFGLVTFSSTARIVFTLSSDMNNIRNMVDTVYVDRMGSTNIADGLEEAQRMLNAPQSGSNSIIILITDGLANERIGDELRVATTIKNRGISIVPVGVTVTGPDYNKLQQIASSTDGVVKTLNFAMLNTRIQDLTDIACRSTNDVYRPVPRPTVPPYFPPYIPAPPPYVPPPRPSTTRIPSIPVNPPTYVPPPRPITTKIPPQNPGFPINCPGSLVVLVIDVSRRLYSTQGALDRTKQLALSLVRQISSSKPITRFAIVTYEGRGKVEAGFSRFSNQNEIERAISSITLHYTTESYDSNISYGLFEARNIISLEDNSGSTLSYILLLSDGTSSPGLGVEFTEARNARSLGIRIVAVGVGNPDVIPLLRITNDSALLFMNPNSQINDIVGLISPCGYRLPIFFSRQDSSCPEEIVFVVDSAGNSTLHISNRRYVAHFMSSIAEEYTRFYDIRGRFAIVQFSDVAEVTMPFCKDLPRVTYSLNHLKYPSQANESSSTMSEGLKLANGLFKANNTKEKLVVLITDEMADNETTNEILQEVQNLNDRNIKFIIAGISEGPKNDAFFEVLAGSSGEVISVKDHIELKNQVNTLIEMACKGGVTFRQNDQDDLISLDP